MGYIQDLFQELMEGVEYDKTNKGLADAIGVNKSAITKFFNGGELGFVQILKAIDWLAPNRASELMESICYQLTRLDNIRLAMEYASVHRNLELLQHLVERQTNCGSRETEDWAKCYQVSLSFQSWEVDNNTLLISAESLDPKYPETRVFKKLIHASICYRSRDYRYMFRLAKLAEKEVETIKNSFLRQAYTVRLCELFAQGYLYQRNDVKKARFYANNVINADFPEAFKAHSFHILGTSFVLENYDECLYNYKRFQELLLKQNRVKMAECVDNHDIAFAKIHWGRDLESLKTDDVSEEAHYEAIWGDKEKAIEILDKIEETPFRLFYRGLAMRDESKLLEAAYQLCNNGNLFYASMVDKFISKTSPLKIAVKMLLDNMKIA